MAIGHEGWEPPGWKVNPSIEPKCELQMSGKKIVILGGGFGGVAAARSLRLLLDGEHSITLVDRQRRTYLCGSLPWLVMGERRAFEISRSLGALIQRGVNYVESEVEGIDLANRRVHIANGFFHYDYLIVATGAEYDWEAVPGASQEHSFYSLETARQLRRALRGFRRGRIVIGVSRLPYKCPPAPYEVAMLLDRAFSEKGVRPDVELHIFTPEPRPLGVLGPEGSDAFQARLAQRGITVHTGQSLVQVDPIGRTAAFLSGESMGYDLLITVPVHRSSALLRAARLTDGSGWVPVDPATLATGQEGVYAVGDATFLPMANGAPMPKAGVFAAAEGELVARNLADEIQGGSKVRFSGEGYCFVDHGGGKGALVQGNFLAEEGPQVAMTSPTVGWHRRKIRFEADWRRWRI